MAEASEREVAGPAGRRAPQSRDRAELTRSIELELDRWIEHRRELQRNRRRRAAWRQGGGSREQGEGED